MMQCKSVDRSSVINPKVSVILCRVKQHEEGTTEGVTSKRLEWEGPIQNQNWVNQKK